MNPQQNMNLDPSSLPLRDIHLPDSVSWWPPAIGWWLLVVLLIAAVVIFIILWTKRLRHRRSPVYMARQSFEQIKTEYAASGDKCMLVRNISILLRRTVISTNPRKDTAALTGNEWLALLDKPMQGKPFSEGPGQVLATLPYRPYVDVETDTLLQLVDQWCQSLDRKPVREKS